MTVTIELYCNADALLRNVICCLAELAESVADMKYVLLSLIVDS